MIKELLLQIVYVFVGAVVFAGIMAPLLLKITLLLWSLFGIDVTSN